MKKISVVISAYKNERTIERCLASVLDQTIPKNEYEVICIVGKSNDKTENKTQNFSENVTVINVDSNSTISKKRNLGVKNADGNIIAFSDGDCRFPNKWIENIDRSFNDTPEADFLCGKRVCISDNFFAQYRYELYKRFSGKFTSKTQLFDKNSKNILTISGNNMTFRRKIFSDGNSFPPFKFSSEDIALELELLKRGYKFKYDPNIVVYHEHPLSLIDFIRKYSRYGVGKCNLRRSFDETTLSSLPSMYIDLFIPILDSPVNYLNSESRNILKTWSLRQIDSLIEALGYFKERYNK